MSGAGAILCACCGPYYELYECCDPDTPLYYISKAEYDAALPCMSGGVRFGLYEGVYYHVDPFSQSDEIPDLPHFPGEVTCDVCAYLTPQAGCDGHRCFTTLENMDVYIPVTTSNTEYEFDDPDCDQIATLTPPCPGALYQYVKFAATDVAFLFTNQQTGEPCGSYPAWYSATLGYAISGFSCSGGVLKRVSIVHGLGSLRTCAIRRECPVEFDECVVSFDDLTWFWDVPDPFDTDEDICEFCGLS